MVNILWVRAVSVIIISGHNLFIYCLEKGVWTPLGPIVPVFREPVQTQLQSKRFVRMYFTFGVRWYGGNRAESNVNWSPRVNWTSVGESLDCGWYRIPASFQNNSASLSLFYFRLGLAMHHLLERLWRLLRWARFTNSPLFHPFSAPWNDEVDRRKGAKWVQFRRE